MSYVEGFVIPIQKKNVPAYQRMAKLACKVWMEYGALDYRECVSDGFAVECGVPFDKLAKIKRGEVVVFAWITYKNKTSRNKIMKKVMADPRMKMDMKKMPFDMKRMAYGGFTTLVKA